MTVDTASMSVREALALPVLRRGLPLVVAGEEHLDRPIRWVHAGEVANMASLLAGGELLLTTGMGIGGRAARQRAFVKGLADREVAGLIIELGYAFDAVPPALAETAEARGLPLVALRRAIPFVAVTEAIHTHLVSSHYALLRRGEHLQRHLSNLILDGDGIPAVLAALASTFGAPVFLEDADGRLLSHAATDGYDLDELDVWEAARTSQDAAVRSAAVRHGGRHAAGRLLVADLRPPAAALAEAVLDHAADIVALALLRERQDEELLARERADVLSTLADGRIAPARVPRALAAAGLRAVPDLLLAVAAMPPADASPDATVAEWARAMRDTHATLTAAGIDAVVGHRTSGAVLCLAALRDPDRREVVADTVAGVLRAALAGIGAPAGAAAAPADYPGTVAARPAVAVAVGRAVAPDQIAAELRATEEAAAAAEALPEAPWHDTSALELRRLLWRRSEDVDIVALVDRVLGPLLEHDARRRNVLLPTLEALLANGGRKAETARALHLNRQALYNRIDRIEELLGADLTDAEQRLTIHFAVYARAYRQRPT
jgi:purine catabolism regulator